MIRGRKSETLRLRNERDFPHLVELALPTKGFRDVAQEIDAFHRERRIPVRRGRNRREGKQLYIRFCFPDAATADAFRYRFRRLLQHAPHSEGKMPTVFGVVVLATLIAAPAADAVCKSHDCLQRTSDLGNAEQIKEGVTTRNGKMVRAGAEACARDLGRKKQWENWTRECSDHEYVSIANIALPVRKL
jgi:hypothetical protein